MKKIFNHILIFFIFACNSPLENTEQKFEVSSINEVFELTLSLSNEITDDNSPVIFEARVERIYSNIYLLKGYWELNSLEIDGSNQNISQYPTYIEFRDDNSYSIIEENAISGVSSYYGGIWQHDLSNSIITLTSLGNSQLVNVSFDTNNNFVALDGFMVWNYIENGSTYKKIFQQTQDITIESITYMAIDCSGGFITSTTYDTNVDIQIPIGLNIGDTQMILGSFEPGLDFDKGVIVLSLYNEDYSTITISKEIKIESTDQN